MQTIITHFYCIVIWKVRGFVTQKMAHCFPSEVELVSSFIIIFFFTRFLDLKIIHKMPKQ